MLAYWRACCYLAAVVMVTTHHKELVVISTFLHRVKSIEVTATHDGSLGGAVRDIIVRFDNGDHWEVTLFSASNCKEEGASQLMVKPWEPQEVFVGGSDAS